VIPHGNKSGGMGPDHSMSLNVHHVNLVPSDVGQFDQHHGVAPGAGGKGDGE
jgi:hypothetical protein